MTDYDKEQILELLKMALESKDWNLVEQALDILQLDEAEIDLRNSEEDYI